jgi:hypothetical protein
LRRMCRGLLASRTAWYSSKCVLTWKVKATKSKRLLFQLAPSTPHTDGTGSGLLPTAKERDWKGESQRGPDAPGDAIQNALTAACGITKQNRQIAMLPTPQSRDFRTGEAHRWENPERSRNLNDAAATVLPPNNGTSRGLKLHPHFVMWLMGYPLTWTDIGIDGIRRLIDKKKKSSSTKTPTRRGSAKDTRATTHTPTGARSRSKPGGTPSSRKSHTKSSRKSRKLKGN